jgi:polysaccharide deacetylase family protein (PEP-CTERM system associated)
VELSTHRVLDLFAETGTKATFFVLGWIAERHPALVRRIVADGHELASHGFSHVRVDCQTPCEFRADIRKTKNILEDAGGTPVRGYRAATFSIDRERFWAYPILCEEGYRYSSSISPISHDLYGVSDAPRGAFFPVADAAIIELPVASVRVVSRNWGCSGGFFRLLPYAVSRWAINRINGRDGLPAMFYFHPWELDPDQPRVPDLPVKARVRHYAGLSRMAQRLERLLRHFSWDRVDRVYDLSRAA